MQPPATIYVLTGERGSGKSTVCARAARDVAQRGLVVAGILTERSDPRDPGSSRQVIDLRTLECRAFGAQDRVPGRDGREAVAAPVPPAVSTPAATAATPGTTDPLTPGWEFGSGVFAWGNEVLSRSTPCDLLVIDEVGPIELLGGRGWIGAFQALRSGEYRLALVVCRPGLVARLEERLGRAADLVLEVTAETRNGLPAAISDESRRLVS